MAKIIQLKASNPEDLFGMIEDFWHQGYDILGIPWYVKKSWLKTFWYCRMVNSEAVKLKLKIGPVTKREK